MSDPEDPNLLLSRPRWQKLPSAKRKTGAAALFLPEIWHTVCAGVKPAGGANLWCEPLSHMEIP